MGCVCLVHPSGSTAHDRNEAFALRAEQDASGPLDACPLAGQGSQAQIVTAAPCRYTLQDMREYGRKKGWCPYYLARHMLAFANVIVYNYQYMLDPKAPSPPWNPVLLPADSDPSPAGESVRGARSCASGARATCCMWHERGGLTCSGRRAVRGRVC